MGYYEEIAIKKLSIELKENIIELKLLGNNVLLLKIEDEDKNNFWFFFNTKTKSKSFYSISEPTKLTKNSFLSQEYTNAYRIIHLEHDFVNSQLFENYPLWIMDDIFMLRSNEKYCFVNPEKYKFTPWKREETKIVYENPLLFLN